MVSSWALARLILVIVLICVAGVEWVACEHRTFTGMYASRRVWQSPGGADGLSEKCKQAYKNLEASNPQESSKMFDAMGKPGAGVMSGNFDWFGDYLGCTSLPDSKYCVSNFNITAYKMSLKVGVCLPKNCTVNDAAIFPEHIDEVASHRYAFALKFISKYLEGQNTTYAWCAGPAPYSSGTTATLTLVAMLIVLLFVGTCMDWYFFRPLPSLNIGVVNVSKSDLRSSGSGYGGMDSLQHTASSRDENAPLLGAKSAEAYIGPRRLQFLMQVLRCFSVPRKLTIILAAEHKPATIPSLHGLRVLSMFWVILGHCYLFPLFTGEANPLYSTAIVKRSSFQFVLNGTFSVDSFFFLSGLLVMYLTLKHLESNGGSINWLMFYIHRFLRLTPLYMFVILASIYLVPHFGSGPMWNPLISPGFGCRKYWWTNLLYINNFYPTGFGSECIAWSWYLANDMQFFLISPLVILAAYHFRGRGVAATTGILVLVSIITRAVITSEYNLLVSDLFNPAAVPAKDAPTGNLQDLMYGKPYTRVAAYAIGLAVGYLVRRSPFRHTNIPREARIAIAAAVWLCVAILLCVPVFSLSHMYQVGGYLNLTASVFYNTFSRISWGLGMGLLVLACHSGYGGYVNSLLSHPLWIPLSRLTYGAYLVHPIVLFIMFLGLDQPLYFTDTAMIFYYIAAVLASYFVSLLCAVGVEYPLLELENRLVGR